MVSALIVFISVNKAKIVKKQSVFDRLGQESPPPLPVAVEPPPKKAEVKALKPLKTSVTVKMKVSHASIQSRCYRDLKTRRQQRYVVLTWP